MNISYRGTNIPNFKNSKQIIKRGDKPMIITNKSYQDIMSEITGEFKLQSPDSPIIEPCKIYFTFYVNNNRRRDIDGMVTTILDCLVKAGIISDDNYKIVREISATVESADYAGCDLQINFL